MANRLNRDIAKGEILVVDAQFLKPEYGALEQRLVVAMGGFGMIASTMGSTVYVRYLNDGEETRIEGNMISVDETNAYQSEHGKFQGVSNVDTESSAS